MDEMNPNNERDVENEPVFDSDYEFLIYLQRLGYDNESRVALAVIRSRLISEISKLTSHNRIPPTGSKLELTVGGSDHPQEHGDVLLPMWKEFANALASVPVSPMGYISLSFMNLQLGQVVSDTLLESFKTLPLQKLMLYGNNLGINGFKFVTDVLKNNSSLETLYIDDDRIRSAHDASCLMKAIREHPNVDELYLENCGIGQNNDIMEAVIPASSNLQLVDLSNNTIGSYGAGVIAACLARNPLIEFLVLSDNNLDNKDSSTIAVSLKSNSNLRILEVDGNRFTRCGVVAFIRTVYGKCLNECSCSNHTCRIDVGEAYGAFGSRLSCMNTFDDPMLNKKLKLMSMVGLFHKNGIKFNCMNKLPLAMMPKVLDCLQGGGLMNLGNLFQFIREWNMPLLYTSRIFHRKRRSERIRENRVKKLKKGSMAN